MTITVTLRDGTEHTLAPMTLAGYAEVVAELGVTRPRFGRIRQRPDFPKPLAELAMGPVWDMGAVKTWARAKEGKAPEPRNVDLSEKIDLLRRFPSR